MTNIAVVYYSSTSNVYQLAKAMAEGASDAGAEVRLRRVPELAPASAIDANPAWRTYVDTIAKDIKEATPADLQWADGYAFGTPTRFGNSSAQLKQFIDTLGGLWYTGELANKGATVFTSSQNVHGGAESTILSLFNVLSHFGAIIVPPGYTDRSVVAAGGNPYGVCGVSAGGTVVSESALAAARHQGKRLADVTARLVGKYLPQQNKMIQSANG